VASNDDEDTGSTDSHVCFNVVASTTYYIAVDGYAGDTGAATLDWGARSVGDTSPCPTLPPQLSGAAHVGQTLTSTDGTWANAGTPSYQWLRCQAEVCRDIAGATAPTYTVAARDVGTAIRLDVQEGSTTPALSTSDPTAAVANTPATHSTNGRIYWTTNRNGLDYEIYSTFANGGSLQRLTNHPGLDTEPAPSPDGTKVAFVRNGHIALMNADGSSVVDTGLQGGFPTWSPDGSRIAYATMTGGSFDGIAVSDADGTNPAVLLSGDPGSFYDLAWSPDGSKIAFSDLVSGDPANGNWDIAVIAADGRGSVTDLTSASTADEHSPAWSPNGSELVFARGPIFGGITDGDLYVMNADGSGQTLLVDGDVSHVVTSGVWSPDGSTILFSRNDLGNSELFTVPAAGGALTQLTTDGNRDELPAWGAPASYSLSVSRAGSGSGTIASGPAGIACGSICSVTFADPTQVTLTATPASGSTFSGWSGACSGTGACVVSMLGNRSVAATFDTASPAGGGGGGSGGGGGGGSSSSFPDLGVTISADSASAPPVGSEAIYHLTVANKVGFGGSFNVTVTIKLPDGFTATNTYSDRGNGCAGLVSPLVCDLDWVSPLQDGHIIVWGKVGLSGPQTITATVTAGPGEAHPADNTATFVLQPAVSSTGGGGGSPAPTPKAVRPPLIVGGVTVGSTLRAVPPTWSAAPSRVAYQWQLCTAAGCKPIVGATAKTLKLKPGTAGKGVRVVATATIGGKNVTSASKKIAVKRA
jgi:Tol biopolymer transport system component